MCPPSYSIIEECPGCGSPLSETLTKLPKPQVRGPAPPFQTALDLRGIVFDIPEIDALMQMQSGAVCTIGRESNTLLTRLCVKSLMPKMQGGLESSSIMVLDGGNCSDPYLAASFARQYGFDIETMLESIVVSRPFTMHQLGFSAIVELPWIIKRHAGSTNNTMVVAISDFFSLFEQEPQLNSLEAEKLAGGMIDSVIEIGDKVLVIVTMHQESIYIMTAVRRLSRRIYLSENNSLKKSKDSLLYINVCNAGGGIEFTLPIMDLNAVRKTCDN